MSVQTTAPSALRSATPTSAVTTRPAPAQTTTYGDAFDRDERGIGSARPLRWHAAGGWPLQRKCACGSAAGLSGTCAECGHRRMLGLQIRAAAPEPADPYEREADRIADEVVAGSARTTPA